MLLTVDPTDSIGCLKVERVDLNALRRLELARRGWVKPSTKAAHAVGERAESGRSLIAIRPRSHGRAMRANACKAAAFGSYCKTSRRVASPMFAQNVTDLTPEKSQ